MTEAIVKFLKVLLPTVLIFILTQFYNYKVFSKLKVTNPCNCMECIDYGGMNNDYTFINSTMCSSYHAMKGKFHQKVISYSYYEPNKPDPYHRHYFNGIEKNLHDIKNKFGEEWSMRLYIQMSIISASQRKFLCNLACNYPDVLEICDVENNPRFGNVSHMFPMNWRFLTAVDPQVDIAFSRDLDSQFIHRELEAVRQFLNSTKDFHFMRDHPHHKEDILGGMWGVKLTPAVRGKVNESFQKMLNSNMLYSNHNERGPDQDLLKEYIWPWAKDFAMIHDSYHCSKYNDTLPYPTQRKDGICNFVACIPELKSRITFVKGNKCPIECRPKNHKDWEYC